MPCPVPAAAGVDAPRARALHALVLEDRPRPTDPGSRRRGLYVDCEITRFDPEHDAVIELAPLPGRSGRGRAAARGEPARRPSPALTTEGCW